MTPGSPRLRVVVATGNPGKVREIRAIVGDAGLDVVPLEAGAGIEFPPEGGDYAANALAKARVVAEALSVLAVADDSGLEVAALDGAPGPYSARYGGEDLDDAERVAHLLRALKGVPETARVARFVCHAAAVAPDGRAWCFEGECRGRILSAPRGIRGFGYDPVFQPEGHACAMAELEPAVKDSISHRGRAFRGLVARLRETLGD